MSILNANVLQIEHSDFNKHFTIYYMQKLNLTEAVDLPSSLEKSDLGILHLKRFWTKTILKKDGHIAINAFQEEWNIDQGLLNAIGIGLEPTIAYLYLNSERFEDFEQWILTQTNGVLSRYSVETFNNLLLGNTLDSQTEKVLTAEDHIFFKEHGYLILHKALSDLEAEAAEKAVWDFLGYDPKDPSTWYEAHPERKGIMVQLFHHPMLELVRKNVRVQKAYEELIGHKRLFVTTDRVSFNPPQNDKWMFQGPRLHWDVSIAQPIPFALQGLLYLTDTAANQGAFTLVPGFHRKIGDWLASLPKDTDPRNENLEALGAVPIVAEKGDFILWHQALPHGSSVNTASYPRIVQYMNWQALDIEIHPEWI
jgi:hypothetical protein